MNSVQILGRLTKDVEIRYTQSRQATGRFSLAVDKSLSKDKKEEMERKGQSTVDFINCIAWGNLAETIEKFSGKGLRLLVSGSIHTGSYDNNGVRVYTTDVLVQNFEIIDWKDRQGQKSTNSDNSFEDFSMDFDDTEDNRIPF